jgi:DNA-binding protein HU-beta
MNTTEFKDALHTKLKARFSPPLTKEEVDVIVDELKELLIDTVSEQEHVLLRGFGTFNLTMRAGREYTVRGKKYPVDERPTVTFKPGVWLKRKLQKIYKPDVRIRALDS